MRPVIGITTYAQEASWGVWRMPAAIIPLDYVHAVERAGGRPVLIPPSENGVEETLDAIDGIVLSGGADIDPSIYGDEAHPETDDPQAHRDAGEMALLAAALERDMPTLAICRGFQLLNVARGGDLVQHLPESVGHEDHRQVNGEFAQHPVEVKEGTKLGGHRRRAGARSRRITTRASAGSATGSSRPRGRRTARSRLRGPVAALRPGRAVAPRGGDGEALFDSLVEEARTYRSERRAE